MNHAITRCPKCATSFRITQNQLKTAKGAVRCGSCLTVFQAGAHLIREANEDNNNRGAVNSASVATSPTSKAGKPQDQRAQSRSENALTGKQQKNPMREKASAVKHATAVRDAVGELKEGRTAKADQARESNQVRRQTTSGSAKAENVKYANQAKLQQANVDSDDILISDDMGGDQSHFDEVTNEVNVTGTHSALSHSLFERDPTKRAESPENVDDDSWALRLLDEQDAKLHRASKSRDANGPDDDISDVDLTGKLIYAGGDFELHDEFKEAVGIPSKSSAIENNHYDEPDDDSEVLPVFEFDEPLEDRESDASLNLFSSIEPEPVEFSYRRKRPFWRSRGLYAGLSIVCVFGLIVQIAIMRFDTLSLKEPYRAIYGVACGFIGCTLANRNDASKIRINQLMVRSHPTTANALIVDAVILNNAVFEQDFPNLILTFTDMQNKPIASRSFAPREYLNGELKGYALMPSLQPITLNFQIVDPGAKAVNYLLTIAP